MSLDCWFSTSPLCVLCSGSHLISVGFDDCIACPACQQTTDSECKLEYDMSNVDFKKLRVLLDRGFDYYTIVYYLKLTNNDLPGCDIKLRECSLLLAECSSIDQASLNSETCVLHVSKLDVAINECILNIDNYDWLHLNVFKNINSHDLKILLEKIDHELFGLSLIHISEPTRPY